MLISPFNMWIWSRLLPSRSVGLVSAWNLVIVWPKYDFSTSAMFSKALCGQMSESVSLFEAWEYFKKKIPPDTYFYASEHSASFSPEKNTYFSWQQGVDPPPLANMSATNMVFCLLLTPDTIEYMFCSSKKEKMRIPFYEVALLHKVLFHIKEMLHNSPLQTHKISFTIHLKRNMRRQPKGRHTNKVFFLLVEPLRSGYPPPHLELSGSKPLLVSIFL